MPWDRFINRHWALRGALILGLVLAIGAAVALSDRIMARRAVDAEHERLVSVARLSAASYQRHVDKFRLVATTLSADPDVGVLLDTSSPAAVVRLNERLAGLTAALDASVIYLLDAQGETIASSNWQQPDSFLGENYGFRAYYTQAMARGEWEQYALGTRSRIPGLFVARRVTTPGGARGVIVVKVRFDRLEREWSASAGSVFVANHQGVILVSSITGWRFQTIRPLKQGEQQRLRAQVEFGDRPLRLHPLYGANQVIDNASAFHGQVRYVTAHEALPHGWSAHVLAPLEPAVASARAFGRMVVLVLTGLLLALAALLAYRRRIIIAREQRESEARINDLKDRLAQANKLSTLGQIAAGVGHEINQPLTAIGVRAQSGARLVRAGRHSEAASAFAEIGALTARMGAITGELRRFARRADGRVGAVSLHSVLEGTQLLLAERIRSTGTQMHVDSTAVRVVGEQGQLEQVLVNLIQNALDAMGDGGRMTITISHDDERASLTIADTGPGIAPAVRSRLFQPFTTSKDDGLGLGLVICRDIVAAFGGALTEAPSAHGAQFKLTLKVAP